jgi:hypothetical protein
MKKIVRAGVSVLACLAMAGVFSVAPSVAKKAAPQNTQAETHSVTGKITAITKNSFTLLIGAAEKSNESTAESNTAKSMNFLVDNNTTIDGNIQVGVDADVTYRIDSGQYIAMNVHVVQ